MTLNHLGAALVAAEVARLDGDDDVVRVLERKAIQLAVSYDVGTWRLRKLRRAAVAEALRQRSC